MNTRSENDFSSDGDVESLPILNVRDGSSFEVTVRVFLLREVDLGSLSSSDEMKAVK